MISDTTQAFAEELTSALLGVDALYRAKSGDGDGLLSVVNTASSCTFEGIADNGLRMIDWIENDDDRFAALMTRYRAGIGTARRWRLHALGWPADQVADWLRAQIACRRRGLGGKSHAVHRGAAALCADLVVLVGRGRRSAGVGSDRTGASIGFLYFLYGRMHSPQSVAMFV